MSDRTKELRSQVLTASGLSVLEIERAIGVPESALAPPAAASDKTAVRLTVIVPAHNEELTIGATLESLWSQSRPPDRVLVVADNCTDDTVAIARAGEADIFTTRDNADKKAGGLDQALRVLLPDCDRSDVVMVMDADTVISPEFLEVAVNRLEADPDMIAIGGGFFGEDGSGLLGQLQRNEYVRYQRHIARRRGKVFVLTGTASLFRAYALQAVADARGILIPGHPGQVYDTVAMTEDNELTVALKTLGAKMVTPRACRAITEVMPDLRAL